MPKSNFKIDEIMLVLIVAIIAVVIGVYDKANQPKETEAEKITAMIMDDHEISFVNNGIVNGNKLKEIQNIKYSDLKNSLKVKNDFCIYLEDEDGNILLAKGSSRLSQDGLVCRE